MTRSRFASSAAAALVLVVAAYANHFHNDFHFDDDHTIQNNAFVRDVRNIPRFFVDASTFSTLPTHQSYRPLVTATAAVDYRIGGGLNPVVFHATNFTLFLTQCVLMLVLYTKVMDLSRPDPSNRWVALFAAALYGVHPANAETVNYVIARSEILSTLGVVAAFVLFTTQSGGPAPPARASRSRSLGLYLVPAAAAMLAKEQAAMFAPLLFVYVVLFEDRRAAIRKTWPAFVVCGVLGVLGQRMAPSFVAGGSSRWRYLLTQPFVVLHYVGTFFLPISLSADSDWMPLPNPLDYRVIVGTLGIVAMLAAARAASRQRETRPIAFGLWWFLLALVPTSSVIPLAEVLNDHRMYFPFVGLTLAVVWSAALVLSTVRARAAATVFAIAILGAMAYGTHERNIVWRTEESLWLDVTRKSPDNGRGLMTYGVIRMSEGDY
ncbi:MAG TPA: hypothetical protein VEU08_21125, partial [Vicinamibacterales bacterium]|nr:hypothetical protein [Vicinamibacterales bacterium]